MRRVCGLLGKKLGHSYSPAIHAMLTDAYEYSLFERPEEEVEDFIRNGAWDGLNVTIPYKKTVMKYCDVLSEAAKAVGSVNTLVKQKDGMIFGDNTDIDGFRALLRHRNVRTKGRKALVLGSGGASVTACHVLKQGGAQVTVISRTGPDNYGNLDRHRDASVIVNTTPVGMFPETGIAPLDLRLFPRLEAVIDIIYNPARTALLLQAEELGIPCENGLYMLAGQARRAAELFAGKDFPESETDRITAELEKTMQNIVLVGMPGSGKSTMAKMLSEATGRKVIETDRLIVEKSGRSIPDLIKNDGEEAFRVLETEVIRSVGKLSGFIISTGGGCVTREENYPLLHQNAVIIEIRRDTGKLESQGRPLSEGADMNAMYRIRRPMYERFADIMVDNNGSREETLLRIQEVIR